MTRPNIKATVVEIPEELWFAKISVEELLELYEVGGTTNHTEVYTYTGYSRWYYGYYNCVTFSQPLTLLKRNTLQTYKYQQPKIKPIKYRLQRTVPLRI